MPAGLEAEDTVWDPLGDPIGIPKKRPSRRGTKRSKVSAPSDEPFDFDFESLLKPDEPHPLTPAGPKLKLLREKTGWTVSEIAERMGMTLEVLAAFEEGDSKAAEKLDLSDLERLASACCGSLTDLLGPDIASVRRALRRLSGSFLGSLF